MRLVRLLRESESTTSGEWRLCLRWLNAYSQELSDLEVTPAQARALLYLQRNPDSSLQHCARVFGVVGSTMSHLVRGLHRKGLITKQRLQQDDRQMLLALSPKGHILAWLLHKQLNARLPLTAKAS
ncbi:MAG: MarR family transcriptional regulator [Nitrospira sp.]|nr:MarR family transcriptional regulator [Nitrospira sp.]MDH5193093.1 MarR family transcriptional regulator [Nitrospira sp.]